MSPADLADRRLITAAYGIARARLRTNEHFQLNIPNSREVHGILTEQGIEMPMAKIHDHCLAAGLTLADFPAEDEDTRKLAPVR